MKRLLLIFNFFLNICICQSQNIPKPQDPCQKLDTNTIRRLIIGTWVEMQDTSHIMTITSDSVEETIVVMMGKNKQENNSYWNYRFEENIFSTDQISCYSIIEFHEGYNDKVTIAINSVDNHYLLMGASGKKVFKKRE
jgi:hypothetical protein